MKSVAVIFTLLLTFSMMTVSAQKEDKPTILFAPQWKVNTTIKYQADLQKTVKQGDFHWTGNYNSIQQLTVKSKDDSSFVVLWKAQGFPVNIFQDYPGPMFDWFQEWSKGKTVDLLIKFNNLGIPISVLNPDSVRSFYLNMVDEFLKKLPSRDVSPLDKEQVKQSLINLKNIYIPSEQLPTSFLSNLSLLFPLFGKTFYENQDLKVTQYTQLPGVNFSVPIQVHTQLMKESKEQYQLTSNKNVLPFNQWRIKQLDIHQ
ncbi:hypothetical protein [Prolixibacter bellariivorans]|uniref:hypothetical protein n=1 Tax=Prolixibacter bellariivorans TaxID=314319 RepID=UPI00055D71A2|nr:hypothetical protein [Prolixibacter bellariivorans]